MPMTGVHRSRRAAHRTVRAESHMMFTPRGCRAPDRHVRPAALTVPRLGTHREHGSPASGDPGAGPGGAADPRHHHERPAADGVCR